MGLFACSGPGAGQAIAENIETGYIHAAIMGGLFLTSLGLFAIRHRWRPVVPAILLGMLLLHPAWTISAISGDCGHTKRLASYVVTVVGSACLLWQLGQTLLCRADVRRQLRDPDDAYGLIK